jgi:hypothetical protein
VPVTTAGGATLEAIHTERTSDGKQRVIVLWEQNDSGSRRLHLTRVSVPEGEILHEPFDLDVGVSRYFELLGSSRKSQSADVDELGVLAWRTAGTGDPGLYFARIALCPQ